MSSGTGADHRQRRDALPAARPSATQRPRRDVVAGVKRRPAAPLLPPHEGRRTSPRQLQETVAGFPRRRRRDPQRREPAVTSRQSASEADKLVQRYLAQLDTALQGVDATRREEILAEVHEHIEEGRTGLDPDDAASVRTLLDQGRRPRCHRRRGRRTAPGQPPLGRVGAVADHLRPGRERAGLDRRDADLVDLPDMESARQADRHLRAARRPGGSFLRPRGRAPRFSWLFGARSALHASAGCATAGSPSRSEPPYCWS